jgi:hypothetical protein
VSESTAVPGGSEIVRGAVRVGRRLGDPFASAVGFWIEPRLGEPGLSKRISRRAQSGRAQSCRAQSCRAQSCRAQSCRAQSGPPKQKHPADRSAGCHFALAVSYSTIALQSSRQEPLPFMAPASHSSPNAASIFPSPQRRGNLQPGVQPSLP